MNLRHGSRPRTAHRVSVLYCMTPHADVFSPLCLKSLTSALYDPPTVALAPLSLGSIAGGGPTLPRTACTHLAPVAPVYNYTVSY
jgi:hypothetical protein